MADAYIGEIRVFAGNFAPRGWAFCNGDLMSIAQNTALFSILGTMYGGDGKNTFALPNLMGRAPMGQGRGPGLTDRRVGAMVGSSEVTLIEPEIPAHNHHANAIQAPGELLDPTDNFWSETQPGRSGEQESVYAATPTTSMSPMVLSTAGATQPHNNMQPYLAMNFIICLYGEFPSRS